MLLSRQRFESPSRTMLSLSVRHLPTAMGTSRIASSTSTLPYTLKNLNLFTYLTYLFRQDQQGNPDHHPHPDPEQTQVCLGRGLLRVQVRVLCSIPAIFRPVHTQAHMPFRPERWENPPEAISSIPGVWGHLFTFLGGPRACIGYRFSLVEYVPHARPVQVWGNDSHFG